MITFLLI